MNIAGIDFSSHAVDVVLLDEDTAACSWHRFLLDVPGDAFDRTRFVRAMMPTRSWWEDHAILAVGLEDPRGRAHTAAVLYRVQGAILACLPTGLLVQPWAPQEWRVAVGLAGNATKDAVAGWAVKAGAGWVWPQDACDAYAIAWATRDRLHRQEAA